MENAEIPPAREGEIEIRFFAKLTAQRQIRAWEDAAALAPFHVLTEPVVRERFEYKDAGLQVALKVTVEIRNPSGEVAGKPALVAETLTLLAR